MHRHKTTYLVDMENTDKHWLDAILPRLKAGQDVEVLLFHTSIRKDMDTETINTAMSGLRKLIDIRISTRNIHCVRQGTTANAADFQIATYLGYAIGRSLSDAYVIVSADKGFDNLIGFWKGTKASVERIGFPQSAEAYQEALRSQANTKNNNQAKPSQLPRIPREECLQAYMDIMQTMGINKQDTVLLAPILEQALRKTPDTQKQHIHTSLVALKKGIKNVQATNILYKQMLSAREYILKNGPLPKLGT